MKKFILSLFIVLGMSFSLMAKDNAELLERADHTKWQVDTRQADAEDPNYLEKFNDTYPQNFPECTGQVLGACMSSDPGVFLGLYLPSTYCCLMGPVVGPACELGMCPYMLCGVNSTVAACHYVGKYSYNYAKDSGRSEVTDRADFSRLCLLKDPLSIYSCANGLNDNCCLPVREFCFMGGSKIKSICSNSASCITGCLSPVVTGLSQAMWSGCLKDCFRFFCGSSSAERKQEVYTLSCSS